MRSIQQEFETCFKTALNLVPRSKHSVSQL